MLSSSGRGGILSVIKGYQWDGLFKRWNIQLVFSHEEGSLLNRLNRAAIGFFHVVVLTVTGRIALLHCHVAMYGSFWRKLLFAVFVRFFGVPVILHLHSGRTKVFYDTLPRFAQRLISRQLSVAEAVIVLSESWRSFVLGIAPKAHVIVMPNYVEIPQKPAIPNYEAQVKLLFLGLIGENKGIYDLLSAFAAAIKNEPRLFLRIGGNGEVEKARICVHELGLAAHVEFLGWVDGETKNELLSDTDIFVLPSYNEGLPVSVLEAMSWGIPVITTPVGGIPELIEDQVNGFLVPPGDISALQQLLECLAQHPARRRQAGLAGRITVQKQYSKEAVLPKLEALYTECLALSKGKVKSAQAGGKLSINFGGRNE
jgi:glycosyltransferase involved in cell wall biosynthesis